jgi:hypothetical protein
MTDFADFQAQIKEWANRGDWSDPLTVSYIRMAEQKFNQDLRVDRMVKESTITSTSRCATLPDDWLSMNLVSIASSRAANGWLPIRYKSNDEIFNLTDRNAFLYYTIVGRNINFGGTPVPVDGTPFQIFYYGEVPIFSDTVSSWLYRKYPSLYLFASLMHADLHAVGEENQALALKTQVDEAISKLNAQHLFAKSSGSRLTRTRARSFG